MARRLTPSDYWRPSLERAGIVAGSRRAQGLAATLDALRLAADLPGPQDYETRLEPLFRCWCRRVAVDNLWVLFMIRPDDVLLMKLHDDAPVPAPPHSG